MAYLPRYDVGDVAPLTAAFNVNGVPTDPTAVALTLIAPDGTTSSPVVLHPGVGDYRYNLPIAQEGLYRYRFVGTGALVQAHEGMVLGYSAVMGSQLVELDMVRQQLGIQAGTDQESNAILAINYASDAIRDYTERSFGIPPVTESRTFYYDGRGQLSIDDCTSITSVTLLGRALTLDSEWFPGDVRRFGGTRCIEYIQLPILSAVSGEMGFLYNLDVYLQNHGVAAVRQPVVIAATWGWPVVPGPVVQAALWVVAANLDSPKPFTAESISDYSYTRHAEATGLPPRAKELLEPYRRIDL